VPSAGSETGASVLDVSVPVRPGMIVYEGDPAVSMRRATSIACGDVANVSELCCGVHTGTHVDAPRHFIDGADAIETLDVEVLCGSCAVVDMRAVERWIDAEALAGVDLDGVTRVLFATRNSLLWSIGVFTPDYVSLAPDAAELLVAAGVRLVGIDYLSVGPPETHRVLLGASVVCVEGLDLTGVEPGPYEVFCGPVKLEGSDGAPARVFLRRA
jgi:arylformamidase